MTTEASADADIDSLLSRLRAIPTATICDAFVRTGLRAPERVAMTGVRPLTDPDVVVAGRARTQQMTIVRDRERSALVNDRELTFRLVEEANNDDFLVVAAPQQLRFAIWGGMLALKASSRNVAGAVIDGATRDVAEIRRLGLPVWCQSVTAVAGGYGGSSVESVNVPVVCGGVEVQPGDFIVADADAVVVVPQGDAHLLIPVCEEMEADERRTYAAVLDGHRMEASYPSRTYYTSGNERQ